MVDYIEAIKKPFSDLKTLGIGAVIGAIPLVQLLNAGYGLKTAEDVMGKKNKLRAWKLEDLGDYIMKIIMMLIITIVYMIVPVIIIAVGVGAAIATALPTILSGAGDMTALVNAIMPSLMVGGPIIFIGALLALVAAFLMPIATLKWLKKGKLGAAFALGSVVKNALTIDYIVSLIVIFVYALILSFVVGMIAGILGLIPIVGTLIGFVLMGGVSFALGVTEYTILAQVIKD